jgi:hypothetical protein
MMARFLKISICTLAFLSLMWFAISKAEGGEHDSRQPLRVLLVQGYNVVSRVEDPNSDFRTGMAAAFARDVVKVLPKKHTKPASADFDRNAFLASYQYTDIYYLTTHGIVPPFNNMQSIQVAPSEDNKNLSPGGNSVATAVDVRRSLMGREGPTLVVMNGCQLADPNDGIAEQQRVSTAFGITPRTEGRAFIGWDWSIVGVNQEAAFARMFQYWTTLRPNGSYPTLDEAVQNTKWAQTKPPRIIGDEGLRYGDVRAKPQPKGRKAKITAFRENEVNHSEGKVTHWTWDLKIVESEGVGVRITEVHTFGWRGSTPQNLPNAVTKLDIRLEPLGKYIGKDVGHIRYTRNVNPKEDGRLLCVYYGIDDNNNYVTTELNTVVRPAGDGKTRLEY